MRRKIAGIVGLALITFFGTRAVLARRQPPPPPPPRGHASGRVFTHSINDPPVRHPELKGLTIPAKLIARAAITRHGFLAIGQSVYVTAMANYEDSRPNITYNWVFRTYKEDLLMYEQDLGPVTDLPLADVVLLPLPLGTYKASIALHGSDGQTRAFNTGPITLAF